MNCQGKKIFLSFFLLAGVLCTFAAGFKHPVSKSLIRFTENKGQWDSKILFRSDLDGGALFMEENGFTYHFYDKETLRKNHIRSHEGSADAEKVASSAFRMSFLNSLKATEILSKNATPDHCNYFIGKDKSKWRGNVKNYTEVYYRNLYSGIDLQVLGKENSLKYNFIVAANASADVIQLHYQGIKEIRISKGALHISTGINDIMEEKPVAYQTINGKHVEVQCRFVLKNHTVSFDFPKGYDKTRELIIDPILVFACSSGSVADNFGMTATYDDAGNLYAGGTVYAAGYPTVNAFDSTWNGSPIYDQLRTDVVITKYDASGTILQYSTYLGGSLGTEVVSSLIVNKQNELMLFGATGSSDFPVTTTAFDTTFSGGTNTTFWANGTGYANGTDLYLAKFSSSGASLLACTYVGGTSNEGTNNSSTLVYNYGDYYRGEIQVDTANNFYIASCTESPDFPVTGGCAQPVLGGGLDGVIFKMSPDLTTMLWSTYMGGSADDGCYALTLDNSMNIYTTGGTSSTNFPTTPGAFSIIYNGGITDGFITKLQSNGAAILNSTFVGTPLYDQAFLIQLDNFFDVYIVGQSLGNMPVTAGAYSNSNSKQFIWKMNGTLSTPLITTIFGNGNGQVNISPSAFLVDICGNIYVSGWGGHILLGTPTHGLPVTPGAYQTTTDGFNFYLFVLAPDATSLLYATYFGGGVSQEHVDGGTSRFDKKGVVYQAVCAGCGGNDDFPVTPGSWPYTSSSYQPYNPVAPSSSQGINMSSNCNMGTFKFDFQTAGVSADAVIFPNDTICAGDSVHFNNASANALNYLWDFGDGSQFSTIASPIHQYTAAGTYNITLIAVDSTGCLFSDTSHLSVVVAPIPVVNIGNDTVVCSDPSLILNAGTSGNIFIWSTGESTQTIVADSADNYWVAISNGTCSASDSLLIQQITLEPDLGPDTSLCVGQTIVLNAFEPGATYLWSTGATSSSVTISITGTYWVQVTLGPCTFSDTINVTFISYPVLSLPTEVIICPDDSVLLDAGGPALEYLWSTSDTTQTITISAQGTYSVIATNYQCATTASVNALQLVLPVLDVDTTLCAGQTVTLSLFFPGATYLWSTGATTSSINVSAAGTYWGTVSFAGCSQSDTMNVAYIQYPVLNMTPSIIMCQGDSAQITAGGAADNYLWSTGETTLSIIADSTGTYIVTASNQQCSTTDSTTVFEITFPPLGPDTTLCSGQSIALNAFVSGANYLWSTGSTSSSINVNAAGQYWVTTTVSFCQRSDTINIGYVPYPVVNLPSTIDLCPADTVILDAGNTATTYLWSNGSSAQTISVTGGGTFIVIASNLHCSVTDTTIVNAVPPVSWSEENTLCNVEKYSLESGVTANSYLWSTGETTPSIEVTEAGTYWLVANSAGCILSDTMIISGGLGSGTLWFPNSFTPNTDGLNDIFAAKGTEITYFHLMIFNRWGELIFDTEKIEEGWDGFYKNQLVQQDVYVWKVKYKTKCSQNLMNSRIGHVTVIR